MRYVLILCVVLFVLGCGNDTQVESVDKASNGEDIKLDGKKRIETH